MEDNLEFIEQMPAVFGDIVDTIGIESALHIIKRFGGQLLYVPKIDIIEKLQRNRQIKEEFTGYNYKELSQKFNLSENQIRIITQEIAAKKRAAPMEGQLALPGIDTE